MKDDKKQLRHQAITAAAYRLLEEKGYDGASMLSIAKAAKASNETLYRWYGDKRGLFEHMVRDNAAETEALLRVEIAKGNGGLDSLAHIGPVLLQMLVGRQAVLLNRAAASDPTGALGAALSAGGRDRIKPLFADLFAGLSSKKTAADLAQLYLSLLIGDWQIRRVIGDGFDPSKAEISERADAALAAFRQLVD